MINELKHGQTIEVRYEYSKLLNENLCCVGRIFKVRVDSNGWILATGINGPSHWIKTPYIDITGIFKVIDEHQDKINKLQATIKDAQQQIEGLRDE